jgi:CrcB protein
VTGFLYLALGAAAGAPARYLVDRGIQARHDTLMPWGTLAVNLVGSLVLGLLTGLGAHHHLSAAASLAVGTGLCGTLTTYSTMSYETLRLFEDGARLFAVANVAVSLTAGLGAAVLGRAVGLSIGG